MSTSVTLPALGESVTEGTVTRWLKQVGDSVEADEPLLEVSTDKVDTEIPSPAAGVLLEIKAAEDETVEVGAVLAVIGDESEAGGDSAGGSGDGGSGDGGSAEEEAPATESEPEPTSSADDEKAAEAEPASSGGGSGGGASSGSSGGGSSGGGSASGTEVTLPALGESVTEGTVTRWLKQVGDSVDADEPLLEVSTDKVDTEIPSPVAGTLLDIKVAEDETVEVGAVLAVIGDASQSGGEAPDAQAPANETATVDSADTVEEQTAAGDEGGQEPMSAPTEAKSEPAPAAEEAARATPPAESAPSAPERAEPSGQDFTGYATPLVRKLAADNNVDLSSVKGTGVGGRIRKQDILAAADEAKKAADEAKKAAEAPAPAAAPAASAPAAPSAPKLEPSNLRGTTEKMSRLRKTIAKRMVESLQVSAQLTATVEVDLTAISRIRARFKDDFKIREGASLSYLPFITKATVEALKVFPKVNATIDTEAGEISYPSAEHVGIAVDTPRGLLVPVIKDAGDLNIAGLAKKIADLAARTRASKVTPDELSGGTFTITNYGSAGTLMDTPIVNQPQVAILGTGALVKRPMVIKDPRLGEVIAVRDMMYLSMSYDHRLVDGADAARFLSHVKARLEEGDFGSEFGL
jgi:2-oxoglutarate dehydrogenase E2 component (dihydrolipoamide succinyltransferase)